jgi:hypothetical protein
MWNVGDDARAIAKARVRDSESIVVGCWHIADCPGTAESSRSKTARIAGKHRVVVDACMQATIGARTRSCEVFSLTSLSLTVQSSFATVRGFPSGALTR